MNDETTDAVAEAREMIAAFEAVSNGRTRFAGQPERADEAYDRNRRALVAHIEVLEEKLAFAQAAVQNAEENELALRTLRAKLAAVRAFGKAPHVACFCRVAGVNGTYHDAICLSFSNGVKAVLAVLDAEPITEAVNW